MDYAYNIGKYKVTSAQYCDFLSPVAAVETYEPYSERMWTNRYGCKLQRTGSPGSYI